MISTPRKRHASRSPEDNRILKRPLTSESPEEGELDDPVLPTIPPISLPPKPPPPLKKVPFPFKKKVENSSVGEKPGVPETPINVFDRFEEDSARKVREEPRRHRNARGPMPKANLNDHWEPGYGRSDSLLSRIEPMGGSSRYDYQRDRDRRRSPLPRHSPRRSRSPDTPSSLNQRDRHRLPTSRTPDTNLSSPRQAASDRIRDRSRERGYERDRDRDRDYRGYREEDSRKYSRRSSISNDPDGRHYRPSHNDYRRGDGREWTRRDVPYHPDRRSSSKLDDKAYDHDRYQDSSRRSDIHDHRASSPGPSIRSGAISPTPLLPPPPPLHPSLLSAPLPSSLPSSGAGHPSSPCSLPLLSDAAPRPPSSTPPPAPPPDLRLVDSKLPFIHKTTIKRPDAPDHHYSPLALDLCPASTAQAMANGTVRKDQEPQNEGIQGNKPSKDSDTPRVRLLRKREPVRRTQKQEVQAYGHKFVGCGLQSDYDVTTKLGEGTFGEVHKAIQKSTGKIVALKRILMHNEKEGMPVTALREIKILKALKHVSIVNILDMFVVRSTEKDPLSVYMVFPYMDHDLAGLLENERVKLQPSHIKLYMKQLLEGTEYMHRNHIVHRDMKAANLLISNGGSLRIADFGLARTYDTNISNSREGGHRGKERKYTNCVVTRWYRPPELLLGARQYGGEVDIWGIGCVLGEMFTRRPILPGTSDLDQLEKIWHLCGTPNQHTWPHYDALPGCEGVTRWTTTHSRRIKNSYESVGPETSDLLDKLLILNPKERMTASQALEHDYFWTDPMPADPKSLPSYEASHEFDKRGHRNYHVPLPAGPPPQAPPENLTRHLQPLNNPRFNKGGPGLPAPPHAYPGDGPRHGGPSGPSYPPPTGSHNIHPLPFRVGAPHAMPGSMPLNSISQTMPHNGYRPPQPAPLHYNKGHHGHHPGHRNDRWEPRGGHHNNNNQSRPPLPLPAHLPPRPLAPLGTSDNDRDRGQYRGGGGQNHRRPDGSGGEEIPDKPAGAPLNYG